MPSVAPPQEVRAVSSCSIPAPSLTRSEYFVHEFRQLDKPDISSRWLQNFADANHWADALPGLLKPSAEWDYTEYPAPNETAVLGAQDLLRAMRFETLLPEAVMPSADGGVAFVYVGVGKNRAVIESMNSGERYMLLYETDGDSRTIDWPAADYTTQRQVLSQFTSYLRGCSLAAFKG